MADEKRELRLQLSAGVSKLNHDIEDLDDLLDQYGELLQEYSRGEVPREELKETFNQVIYGLEDVFSAQDWIGETTADLVDEEIDTSYDKFLTCKGMVFASQTREENYGGQIKGSDHAERQLPFDEEHEELVEAWKEFEEVYGRAVNLESSARDISLEEGAQEEGINPYAFETPFMILEDNYERVIDLNETVEASYR